MKRYELQTIWPEEARKENREAKGKEKRMGWQVRLNGDGLRSLRRENPFHTRAESIRGKTFPACLDDIDVLLRGKRFRQSKKRRIKMARNSVIVPEAKEAMKNFKMQAASEVGVNLKDGYNGELTSRQAGSVGGQMVKKMIESYENSMKNSK